MSGLIHQVRRERGGRFYIHVLVNSSIATPGNQSPFHHPYWHYLMILRLNDRFRMVRLALLAVTISLADASAEPH